MLIKFNCKITGIVSVSCHRNNHQHGHQQPWKSHGHWHFHLLRNIQGYWQSILSFQTSLVHVGKLAIVATIDLDNFLHASLKKRQPNPVQDHRIALSESLLNEVNDLLLIHGQVAVVFGSQGHKESQIQCTASFRVGKPWRLGKNALSPPPNTKLHTDVFALKVPDSPTHAIWIYQTCRLWPSLTVAAASRFDDRWLLGERIAKPRRRKVVASITTYVWCCSLDVHNYRSCFGQSAPYLN